MTKLLVPVVLIMAVILGLKLAGVFERDTILGKWHHGLPDTCPPSMDSRMYEELKKLPESYPYFLELSKNGQLLYVGEEQTFSGRYRFVSENDLEITWNNPTLSPDFGLQEGVYEI